MIFKKFFFVLYDGLKKTVKVRFAFFIFDYQYIMISQEKTSTFFLFVMRIALNFAQKILMSVQVY